VDLVKPKETSPIAAPFTIFTAATKWWHGVTEQLGVHVSVGERERAHAVHQGWQTNFHREPQQHHGRRQGVVTEMYKCLNYFQHSVK